MNNRLTGSERLTIFISILALIVAIFALCFQIIQYQGERKDVELGRAPSFILTSMIYQPSINRKYPETYKMPENSEFILGKKHFNENGQIQDSVLSLIINACPLGTNSELMYSINQDIMKFTNIGFDCIYFEIESIDIHKKDNQVIHITPFNNQSKVANKIDSGNAFDVYVSLITNSETGIFDLPLVENNDYLQAKLNETGGELLNSTLEKMADLWLSIDLNIITKNSYNESYQQQLSVYIEDNTYYTKQTEPIKIIRT